MRTNRNWVNGMVKRAAILACILFPLSGIAADFSLNEQLLRAAESGSLEQVKALLAKGGNVNARDEDGQTALSLASADNYPESVEYLKAHGAK